MILCSGDHAVHHLQHLRYQHRLGGQQQAEQDW